MPYIMIRPGLWLKEVSLSSIPKDEILCAYLFVNHDAYSSYCKVYNEYFSWVPARNEVRFEGTMSHGQGYDAKNMMHTIRLLQQAKEILSKKELHSLTLKVLATSFCNNFKSILFYLI